MWEVVSCLVWVHVGRVSVCVCVYVCRDAYVVDVFVLDHVLDGLCFGLEILNGCGWAGSQYKNDMLECWISLHAAEDEFYRYDFVFYPGEVGVKHA